MNNRAQMIATLKELGISPKRSLGQNFLINESVILKIIKHCAQLKSKSIVEIGPGLGALTEPLKGIDPNLLLIELDDTFARRWRERDYQVIHKDALKVDWKSDDLKGRTVLVSNLPYQISASLVIELSECVPDIKNMVLMFQKEVAQRIMSAPSFKSYGLLSVVAQCFWKLELLLEAGPSDFYPAPAVASRVVTFESQESPLEELEESVGQSLRSEFIQFVKKSFSHRRTKLIKNLLSFEPQYGLDLSHWTSLFDLVGLDVGGRPETLTPVEYMSLYIEWKKVSSRDGN